ncbi:MAG: BON domain-containing protein [Deltaproteobacteria bacterium]|nr:BON domain-containing protein [Deltaproteobacteria bacterium]
MPTLRAKRAAARQARGVVGVWSVNNRIKVRPGTPSDITIKGRLSDALRWDPYVERYEINVSVVDGTVYLTGNVDTQFEKARADDLASRHVGVRAVKNYLTVNEPNGMSDDPYVEDWSIYDFYWYENRKTTTAKNDWEIKKSIQDELFWSPFVDADQVKVQVEDGTAILTGTVDTWAERRASTENALEGGAVSVTNELAVEYGPEYYRP